MKKNLFVVLMAVATMMTSCGGQKAPKANLKSDIDSLSYAIGMARTRGFIEYLVGQMEVDTTYMKQFVKGFCEGAKMGGDPATNAYLAGLQIGNSEVMSQMVNINEGLFGLESGNSLDQDNYMAGFLDGSKSNYSVMDPEEAANVAERLYDYFMELKFADAVAESKAFIDAKAKEDGVHRTPSGVLYKIIKEGKGEVPGATSIVKVTYKGSLINGQEFDSAEDPIEMPVNGVIKGWQEVLQMMPVGSEWEVYIPQELGYGSQDNGIIPPYSALVFTIGLKEIVEK